MTFQYSKLNIFPIVFKGDSPGITQHMPNQIKNTEDSRANPKFVGECKAFAKEHKSLSWYYAMHAESNHFIHSCYIVKHLQ